jgi:hypothetical protein
MKRIIFVTASVIVTISIIFGVVPALAGESRNDDAPVDQPSYTAMAENSYNPYAVKAGKTLAFSLSATDPDNDFLVYSASNLPPGATFDSLTGVFSWTPGYDQAGIYNVHFEVSDGSLSDSEDITITVYDADIVPESKQSLISVTSLRITPSKANTGKNINISVTVNNNGNSTGEYIVMLMINGVVEGSQTVTLAAGSTQNVKFSTSKNIPGTYNVDVNGLTGSFTIETQSNGGDTQSKGANPPSKGGKKH